MLTLMLLVGMTAAPFSGTTISSEGGNLGTAPPPAGFRLSNTLGDGMVLQRAPASAVVWGFGSPGLAVTTTFGGKALATMADGKGVWRQVLPPTQASKTEQKLTFTSSEGTAELSVLFGEVSGRRSFVGSRFAGGVHDTLSAGN
jgi:hypothetical protein